MEEHSRCFGEIRELIVGLGSRIQAVDQKVDRFREELSARIGALDRKVSRQFIWPVGIQVAVLLSVIGALLRD